jgi:hypothetical protein
MPRLICTPSLPAPRPACTGRLRQLTLRRAPAFAALLVAALGCRDDAESPTAPESGPALTTTATAALSFRQVSAGFFHSCGVTPDNRAYCWGDNGFGEREAPFPPGERGRLPHLRRDP